MVLYQRNQSLQEARAVKIRHTLHSLIFLAPYCPLFSLDRAGLQPEMTDHRPVKDLRSDILILRAFPIFVFECRER